MCVCARAFLWLVCARVGDPTMRASDMVDQRRLQVVFFSLSILIVVSGLVVLIAGLLSLRALHCYTMPTLSRRVHRALSASTGRVVACR